MSDDFDILIKNAMIVNGTGEPPYKGAIAVEGERIAAVARARYQEDHEPPREEA